MLSQGEKTRKRILLALKKLEQEASRAARDGEKSPRISISAVAKLAQVSHTLIHVKYPDVADRIRSASRGSLLQQRQHKHAALKRARLRATELRRAVSSLQAENRGLASENARLLLQVSALEARVRALEAGAIPIARNPGFKA